MKGYIITNKLTLLNPNYRPDIDGLRAVAVLAVVAFHAFPSWVRGGFIGVDVFFVISGYLISTIIFENLDKCTFSFYDFYARRIKRIFPAVILVLIFCFIIGWFSLVAEDYKQIGKHIAGGAGFVSNFVLLNEAGYFDNSAETKPLLHLWSLGIEEQFYIIWPLFLWLLWKFNFNILISIILVTVVSFSMNIRGVNQDNIANFYSPQFRFWELTCGSLLSWLKLYKNEYLTQIKIKIDYLFINNFFRINFSNILSFIGSIFLIYGFFAIHKNLSYPGFWALVPVLGAVLIIAAGSNSWINRTVLSNKIFIWFGLISFPIYLWHWPLLIFARIFEDRTPLLYIRMIILIITILFSWITYIYIEKPLRYRKLDFSICLIMAFVGSIGYYTYYNQGFKFRNINKINEAVNQSYQYDWNKEYRGNECFIASVDENSNQFGKKCGIEHTDNDQTLLIWGDSYAASFYRGFEENGKFLKFSVSQFNASGCPPILDFAVSKRKECIYINNIVFKKIEILKPDILILSANWLIYNNINVDDLETLDYEKFNITVSKIKEIGIKNIIIIGQLPVYNVRQAHMLKIQSIWSKKPDLITYKNFNENATIADDKLKEFAIKLGVNFISPLDILCKSSGCLISIPGDNITPLSWDNGHLNTNGSIFLVSKFFELNLIKF